MTDEMIKSFTSIDALKSYAKINGFDSGRIDVFVAQWELLQNEPVIDTLITAPDTEEEA